MSGKSNSYGLTRTGRPCRNARPSRNGLNNEKSKHPEALSQDAGVSLLELLVVLAILAITFALSANSIRDAGHPARLQPMAQRMAADLRLARAISIATSRSIKINIDVSGCNYHIETRGTTSIRPCAIALAPVAAGANPATSNSAEIAFFPDGSSSGGQFTLSAKRTAYTLRIDWLTGAVTVTVTVIGSGG